MDFLFAKQSPEMIWGAFAILIVTMGLIGIIIGLLALRNENKAFEKNKQEWQEIFASLESTLESERKNNP
ncbi:MAG: hypothetical protein LBS60_13200 [Deltaproteobacteria bacterium]|jgi:uncharacterized membrane-anchored protein YhcB (DUF1043 family)|nr:hypothetical protein [Deltaproteobacteria bacterium]